MNDFQSFDDIGFSLETLSLIAYYNLEYWLDDEIKQALSKEYDCCEIEAIALDIFIQDFNMRT